MDVLAWLWWLVASGLSVVWSLFWFLISGWVSTLLQIALLVSAVYYFKYGWRRAPAEIWKHTSAFGRFFLNWIRAREPAAAPGVEVRETVRVVRTKEFGDINLSTALTLLMLAGAWSLVGLT
jgi:hypothetical protein